MSALVRSLPYWPWIPRAVLELAKARIKLRTIIPQHIVDENARVARKTEPETAVDQPPERSRHADRTTFLIPRIAARVPWRSDCLVQALAAQRWLARDGLASVIEIGVSRGKNDEFRAHAWLHCHGETLLGGEISEFAPLLSTNQTKPS